MVSNAGNTTFVRIFTINTIKINDIILSFFELLAALVHPFVAFFDKG